MTVVTTPVNDLMRIVARAGEIAGSYGRTRTKPERIDAATRAMVTVEHIHQELETFTKFVYRRSSKGRLLHVLPDGQLGRGVWAPWGASGKATLTRTQRDILRRWLLTKAETRLRPPFLYNRTTRRWYVDLQRYPDKDSALQWLSNHQLTAGEWLNLL